MDMLHEPEFWVAIGFVLVIALLLWKGVPAMVGKMLDQRAAVIAAELDEARRLHAEANALLADYKTRAAGAEAEAAAILTEAKAEAARFAEDSRTALKAQIERRARIGERDRLAAERDRAGAGLMDAGEHFHQRRFPGAVVAHQRDDFAGMHVELDVRQGRDRSEVLRDAAQAQHQLAGPGPCCGVVSHLTDTS